MIDLLVRDRHERDATGATLFGAVTGEWPCWFADAVYTDELLRKLEHNERSKIELAELTKNHGR